MPLSNKANKANKAGNGLDQDELASAGQESSFALSAALDQSRLAFAEEAPPAVRTVPPRAEDPDLLRRLNARHRQEILVAALTADVTSALDPQPPAGVDSATLSVGGKPRLTLALRRRDDAFWSEQVALLRAQAWNREERLPEIVLQQADLLSFLALALPMGAGTHPRTLVLMEAVLEAVFRVMAPLKFLFSMARPNDLAPDIAPVIVTPAHSAFPSGHAGEAFASAALLGVVFPGSAAPLRRLALRLAANRGYAGVHFPIDHYAGAVLGDTLGAIWAARLFGVAEAAGARRFIANGEPRGDTDFPHADVEAYALGEAPLGAAAPALEPQTIGTEPGAAALHWIAAEVLREAGRGAS